MQTSQSGSASVASAVPVGRAFFPLLRYFSVASFIAIAVATVVLTLLQQRLAVRELILAQEQHHTVLTQSVAVAHWEEFAEFFRVAASLDTPAMRQHPEFLRLLKQLEREFAGTPVLKIKTYDRSGRTMFSTDPKQLGEDKSNNAGFLSARDNVPASELTHRDQFSAFEQTIENIDVVSSYVPVRPRGSREIKAVFEIYSDISPLLHRVRETRNTVAWQVTAALVGLYLVLFFIVRHAGGVIKAQALQSRRDEDSLRAARQDAVQSERFHRALIERSSDAVVVLGADLNVRYATLTDTRVLGLSEHDVIGRSLTGYACEEYRDAVAEWLEQVVKNPEGIDRIEFEGEHAAKGRRHFLATATNLRSDPAVDGIVVNIRDFTERKLAELEVRRIALYDGLTGLARREFFLAQMRKSVARAARHKEILAMLFLDLDGFKKINDTLGHDTGDTLLKEVAARLRSVLREDDTMGRIESTETDERLSRLGGDEFTLLLVGLNDPQDAGLVAQRLLEAVGAPYQIGANEVVVTISIGIAVFPRDGDSVDDLMTRADTAMYIAKQQGKNTYRYHSDA